MNSHQSLDAADSVIFPPAAGDHVGRSRTRVEDLTFLLHEANHRIRNVIAMMEAIVRQTHSESVEDYRAKVLARMSNFQGFHELGGWNGQSPNVTIADLLKQTLGAYSTKQGQIIASGPDVELEPELALALHLVFHELAMNAGKHGALTSPAGSVAVNWALHATAHTRPKLAMVWLESAGPTVRPPRNRGFGSRVIARALDGYGKARLEFHTAGVACYILIDLERNTRAAA